MKKSFKSQRRRATCVAIIFLMLIVSSCNKWQDYLPGEVPNEPKFLPGEWTVTNIASNNLAFRAFILDPLLSDSRGFVIPEPGRAWVTAHGSGVVNLYNIVFATRGILKSIQIPSATASTGGKPAAIAINDESSAFPLSNKMSATLIIGSTDGIISGWNEAAGDKALVVKNNSSSAVYTGIAIGPHHGQTLLYAANFQSGKVEVYNKNFQPVHAKKFIDPLLPKGFAPFNVRVFEKHVIVTYAKPGANGEGLNEVGNGIVNVFNHEGVHIKRFATKGVLNSPWGITILPSDFFPELGKPVVLIGNHGDGKLLGFSIDGEFLGELKNNRNESFVLSDLWGLSYEVPGQGTAPASVYFTSANPGGGIIRGLFGSLLRQ